jgi:hypothetical protein
MPPSAASPTGPYCPYLTDPAGADRAVEVKQNIADNPLRIKGIPPDLQRVFAQAHEHGLHLVFARELRETGGQR